MTISERGRKAEQIIGENPYDVDAWGVLLREAQVTCSNLELMISGPEKALNFQCFCHLLTKLISKFSCL